MSWSTIDSFGDVELTPNSYKKPELGTSLSSSVSIGRNTGVSIPRLGTLWNPRDSYSIIMFRWGRLFD